jgi:hypothetical protein
MVGNNAERIWTNILRISDGNPHIPVLPDGREGPPVIPTAGDALAASAFIITTLYGKPVPQTEIIAAEKAAAGVADLHMMSDEELKEKVLASLRERNIPIPGESQTVDGEFKPIQAPPTPVTEEDDE